MAAGAWAALATSPVHAGVGSAVPAIIATAVLVDDTTAVKGNPVTYSTKVPLSSGTVYYVYVRVQPGTFNGTPAAATVLSSNNATLQTALQGATAATLSDDKSFVVYTLAATGGVVPVNSTISFTPQGTAGNDGSVDGLFSLATGGYVNAQISIGSSANTKRVLSDIDSAAGGNFIAFGVPTVPDTTCRIALQAGYWWSPAEPGRGYYVEQQANAITFAAFMYAPFGRATWYQAQGTLVDTGSANGTVCTFNGALSTYANGQTLGGAYQAASAPVSAGNVSINFLDNAHATVMWPGGSNSSNIQRFPFAAGQFSAGPTQFQPQTGLWWNPAEAGRGYGLEVQNNMLYYTAFMYDASGNPVWYVTGPGGVSSSGNYSGTLQQFGGGQVLNGDFKTASVVNANAGATTLQFSSPTGGVMTYPNGTQAPLQRYKFLQAGIFPNVTVLLFGDGSIASSPEGIDCPDTTCNNTFAVGTRMTLIASPAAGSSFVGWSGACIGGGSCNFDLGPNAHIGATFVADGSNAIVVTVSGPGTISSTPAGILCTQVGGTHCSAVFDSGVRVVLTEGPNFDGSTFAGWSGDCAGFVTALNCTLNAGGNYRVQARFLPPTALPDNGGAASAR